ncbi:ATP-dependent RNA helicase [Prevotella sp. P5-92]|uniref:DEAD/DEAH box helicase n=1 Tax=Prevotella sp. P5-92 TaxID=2024222 RepID=UPI000B9725EE|nr:DEAD/DEAH box helicase [Prevotella sp. P5-92]OYP58380.1 ATP-dependent RNA helicase [Prevotella sp. P5-92]
MKTFEELGVSEEIRKAIEELGFENPMPVQEEVIPYLLGNRNDVIALAQTGTGKTAAFGIPILQKIDPKSRDTQALVLSPTRELCLQIADDLRDFSKYMKGVNVVAVYGGTSIENQIHALRHGAQIIVATPGRLIDLMHRGKAKLEMVNNVVLDEADEMLNMGFSESINEIFEGVPEDRNTLLFSATMSREIEKIAKSYLREYKEIVVGSRNEGAENVNHIYYLVNAKDKYLALKRIVDFNPKIFGIIFCRTKLDTQEIADKLIRDGYNAESLHGDLSQQQRDLTMQKFRQHLTQLLVATDVAARGLDVDDLTHVINFGLPDDIESYTHRSGRTGRAGKKGTSISIIHTREKHKMRAIEKEIGKSFVEGDIPSPKEICKKQLYKVMDQIVKTDVNDEEIDPFMKDIKRYFEFIDKEDIIKKIVSMEFGKFLAYYADAPEIEKPSTKATREDRRGGNSERKGQRGDRSGARRGQRKAESGYRRLFINLGKSDGFYPGEVMQYINKHVEGRQDVGHIDLMSKFSYIEVPEKDADKVIRALDGTVYKGREVRCNDADSKGHGRGNADENGRNNGKADTDGYGRVKSDKSRGGKTAEKPKKRQGKSKQTPFEGDTGDWRQFFKGNDVKFKGDEPDFSEEGWAIRKPRKKK